MYTRCSIHHITIIMPQFSNNLNVNESKKEEITNKKEMHYGINAEKDLYLGI